MEQLHTTSSLSGILSNRMNMYFNRIIEVQPFEIIDLIW